MDNPGQRTEEFKHFGEGIVHFELYREITLDRNGLRSQRLEFTGNARGGLGVGIDHDHGRTSLGKRLGNSMTKTMTGVRHGDDAVGKHGTGEHSIDGR
jgi:hypothetical protein